MSSEYTALALAGILLLATVCESLVEYLIRPIVKPWVEGDPPEKAAMSEGEEKPIDWRGLLLRYTAAVVGLLLCVAYQADLLAMLGLHAPWPWVGNVITGLLIGRGANFIHDFASRWLTPSVASDPQAEPRSADRRRPRLGPDRT